MKTEFFMSLSSDNSIKYFPQNAPSKFTVRLPHKVQLQGEWHVALTEIQFPQSCYHIPKENWIEISTHLMENQFKKISNRIRPYVLGSLDKVDDLATAVNVKEVNSAPIHRDKISCGIFNNLEELINSLNNLSHIKNHLKFEILPGNFIQIKKKCSETESHRILLSPEIACILGSSKNKTCYIDDTTTFTFEFPASLNNCLPENMYLYLDMCESYITGDAQTPLLRRVPFDKETYVFGTVKSKEFALLKYIPLQLNEFETIEIDIRDEHGHFIPFLFGTLRVELHFKKIY